MDKIDTSHLNRIVNHCRIHQLLSRGTKILHRIFRNRWSIYKHLKCESAGTEWEDDEKCGAMLLPLCDSVAPKMKEVLRSGKVDLWDITLTNLAIQAVSKTIRSYGAETNKEEDRLINELRELRNTIAHGKTDLSDDELSMYWDQLSDILIKLGDNSSDIVALKKSLMKLGQPNVNVTFDDSRPEFTKLKEEANKLFKDQKYDEAIQVYSKILNISGTTPENQATIYSNRSAAYLMLKIEDSLRMAIRDANWAIQLYPCWWKGYYRLGKAQFELGDLSDAADSFNKALALNPQSKEVRDELSAVRSQIGVVSRQEHLRPAQQPPSIEDVQKEINTRLGISEELSNELQKIALNTPAGNIIRGHRHRDGHGVPQDYIQAAAYYAKAARDGIPEGMYNLGRLYDIGKGVERDYDKSMYWLNKAATAELIGIMIGSGIPEAQHSLGLKYAQGVGVTQDFRKAAEWYEKATMIGFGPSANNLGLLYQNGQGVERSHTKAFQYFKLAAKGNDTPGMINLAHCYFTARGTGSITPTNDDRIEGMKWLRIAAELGDMVAAMELEDLEKLTPDEAMLVSSIATIFSGVALKTNPLDQEQYGKYIREAEKKGSSTAMKLLDIWKYINIAMDAFKKKDSAGLIAALSKAIRLDYQIVKVPELFKTIIEGAIKTHPDDLDVITCFIGLNIKKMNVIFITKCLMKFPTDEFLMEMLIVGFIIAKEYEEALYVVNKALNLYPKSVRILYGRAIALATQKHQTEESIKAYDAFLAVAPEDHDKVPAILYRKASYYCVFKKDEAKCIHWFEAGLKSEKKQLPCFLPYDSPDKAMLEKVYMIFKEINKQQDESTVATSFTQNWDQIRSSPQRKLLLTKHRQTFIEMEEKYMNKGKNLLSATIKKPPNSPKPPSLVSLKKITLKDMDPTKDKVYDGYVLEVRIIDWPFLMHGIATVIEDEDGNVERVSIYDWPKKEDTVKRMKTFRPNCMMSIINPYMRMAQDNQSIIRVESPAYIRLDDSLSEKKCYCCGREAKTQKCSKCLMMRYCSKECQKLDWTEFNHKDVCKHLKKYSNKL